MNSFIESSVWCIVQVTLVTIAATCAYTIARRVRAGGYSALLIAALAAIGAITCLSVSPAPTWTWVTVDFFPARSADVGAAMVDISAASLLDESPPVKQPESVDAVAAPSPPMVARMDRPTLPPAVSRPGKVQTSAAPARPRPWWHYAVFTAWAASAFGAIRFVLGALHLRRCRRDSPLVGDAALEELAQEVRVQFNLKRKVELREMAKLSVPATIGWRRPIVLLPANWREWSTIERRAVLAHELAHIRERHFPAWLAGQLAVVAHFYHPLVHWLARRLRCEQEIAADTRAATLFTNRRQYAAVLAGLALGPSPSSRAIAPLGLFMSRPLLMRRIAMLRQSNAPTRRATLWKRGLVYTVLGTMVIGVVGVRAAADGDLPAPPDSARTTRVIAMLRVAREESSIVTGQSQTMSDDAWKTFCSSQVALLKSDWLLTGALRDPAVSSLSIFGSPGQALGWLQRNLLAGFIDDSELMYVMVYCNPSEADQAKIIVDATVKAYYNEVSFRVKQRKLVPITALTQSLTTLQHGIARKTSEYLTIARELGSARADSSSGVLQQLNLSRLDRIETELMRLESDQLEMQISGKEGNEKFYAARIAQLETRREELLAEIRKSNEASVDLTMLRSELDQLQRIADDMRTRLKTLEVDRNAPPRIEIIHEAIATDAVEPAAPAAAKADK